MLFSDSYLRLDGILCIRILTENLTDVVTAEIVCELWNNWRATGSRTSSVSTQPLLSSGSDNV